MQAYIHKDIGKEIKAVSGYFTYLEEIRINFQGRDLLCVVGVGIVDNSCCGVGGCLFIEVPGYIVAWKSDVDDEGRRFSWIDPVESEDEKNGIRKALHKIYAGAEISFGC